MPLAHHISTANSQLVIPNVSQQHNSGYTQIHTMLHLKAPENSYTEHVSTTTTHPAG
jgi:hypothetical protein